MTIALPDFSRARLLVIGDLMLDRYWQGETARISPEAPVPIVRIGECEERPGGAGNVAINLASLGATVWLDGIVGDDEAGRRLDAELGRRGIHCSFSPLTGVATITKLRVLSRHQQLLRLDFEGHLDDAEARKLAQRATMHLAEIDAVVLSDYAKGTLAHAQTLIRASRAAGKPVLVDPKGSDFGIYRGATLLTPNQGEFEAVVGRCRDDSELVERGAKLRRDLQLEALLITRGEHGMTLIEDDSPPFHIEAQAREVFDVTGAGDTVIATLAAALATGATLQSATVLANAAAGIVVGKLGAVPVAIEELRDAIGEARPSAHLAGGGVLQEQELLSAVQRARARGERIVMTNGCFDLLHAGHVSYLARARALGGRLIVAVNDDASVARLKGPARPIMPLAQRMQVLAGVKNVDWVVAFSEDTPERLICRVLPDVLVKGGDYHADAVAGGDCVKRNGGEVVIADLEPGLSTSALIDAIRTRH